MATDWLEYIRKMDSLLLEALKTCAKHSLTNLYDALHGDGNIGPSPFINLYLDLRDSKVIFRTPNFRKYLYRPTYSNSRSLKIQISIYIALFQIAFEPTIRELNDFLGTINLSVIDSITRFPRLFEKFKLPKPDGMTSFAQVISIDEDFDRLQHNILEELNHNQMQLMEYLDTWTPFKQIWEVDKTLFFKTLDPRTANEFDKDITLYGETANQVQMQETTVPVYFTEVHSFKLKTSILSHIDKWIEGYIELLKARAYARINSKNFVWIFGMLLQFLRF